MKSAVSHALCLPGPAARMIDCPRNDRRNRSLPHYRSEPPRRHGRGMGHANSCRRSEPGRGGPFRCAAARPRARRRVLPQDDVGRGQLQLPNHDLMRAGQAAQLARSMHSALRDGWDNGQFGGAARQPATARHRACGHSSIARAMMNCKRSRLLRSLPRAAARGIGTHAGAESAERST